MCNENVSGKMISQKLSHHAHAWCARKLPHHLCALIVTELHLDLSNYLLYSSPPKSSASKTSAFKNESLLAGIVFNQHSLICLVILSLCEKVVVVIIA